MLKKYRNALLKAIEEANFEPREFRLIDEDKDSSQLLRLQLGDSPLHFSFKISYIRGERLFYYQIGYYTRDYPTPQFSESSFQGVRNFDELEKLFKQWLNEKARLYLEDKAEQDEDRILPDLWAELHQPLGSTQEAQALQNTPFSSEEQKRIADTLKVFENKIQSEDLLDAEQVKLLHDRLEYLVEASKRIGRKDWLMAAAGAIFGFTLQAGLTSGVATQVINAAGEALRWIAHTPLLLP